MQSSPSQFLQAVSSALKNQSCELYSICRGTKSDGQSQRIKVFHKNLLDSKQLNETIEFNLYALTDIKKKNYVFPQHFHEINQSIDKKEHIVLITDDYETRLDSYLLQSLMHEKEALDIFGQIMKSIYSLLKDGVLMGNIRAEHFVKVGNLWKLDVVVYNTERVRNPSYYQACLSYNPPELWNKQSNDKTDDQIKKRIVWDLGCLLIHILTGRHKLRNKTILDRFKDSLFDFFIIGIEVAHDFSEPVRNLIGQMCHYNAEKRMSLEELFMHSQILPQIAADFSRFQAGSISSLPSKIKISVMQSVQRTCTEITYHKPKSKSTKLEEIFSDSQRPEKMGGIMLMHLEKIMLMELASSEIQLLREILTQRQLNKKNPIHQFIVSSLIFQLNLWRLYLLKELDKNTFSDIYCHYRKEDNPELCEFQQKELEQSVKNNPWWKKVEEFKSLLRFEGYQKVLTHEKILDGLLSNNKEQLSTSIGPLFSLIEKLIYSDYDSLTLKRQNNDRIIEKEIRDPFKLIISFLERTIGQVQSTDSSKSALKTKIKYLSLVHKFYQPIHLQENLKTIFEFNKVESSRYSIAPGLIPKYFVEQRSFRSSAMFTQLQRKYFGPA